LKLRLKTLVIVGLALLCLNLVMFTTSSNLLLDGYSQLERREVERDVQRAISVVMDNATDLDATARDYSEWDTTYSFVETHDPAYERSNFVDRTFDYLRLNALILLDRSGKPLLQQGYNLESRQRVPIPRSLWEHLQPGSPLLTHSSTTSAVHGLLQLPEGPMMVAARPIVTSEAEGPIRGTLLLGRFLAGPEIERVSRLTQLNLSLQSLHGIVQPSSAWAKLPASSGRRSLLPSALAKLPLVARSAPDITPAPQQSTAQQSAPQQSAPKPATSIPSIPERSKPERSKSSALAQPTEQTQPQSTRLIATPPESVQPESTQPQSPQSPKIARISAATMPPAIDDSRSNSEAEGSEVLRHRAVKALLLGTETVAIETLSDNRLASYALLDDLYGQPAWLVRVELDRAIYNRGLISLRYTLVLLVLGGLIFGAITLLLLERLVLARLMRLSEQVSAIGTSGNPTQRVEVMPGTDELSELAAILNATLDRLQVSQSAVCAAEAQYRSIFENAIEGIFQTTPDGRYLSANPALARIYGYSGPDVLLLALNATQNLYVNPNRRKEFVEQIRQKGSLANFESEVYRADGRRIWISESARAVYDEDGELLYYEGTVEDITERRRSEASLRTLKDRLEAILAAVPGTVSRVGRDLRYLEVNHHLAESFGRAPEEFIGQDIGFLGYGQEFREFVAEFFASPIQEATREVSRPVGDRIESYLVVAQKYNNDQAAFVLGIDITERKEAERAVREAEERFRSIFENAIEGIYQALPDGRYLSANPAMARLYGYESPTALIEAFDRMGGPPYVQIDRARELLNMLEASGSVSGFESEVYRADGQHIWISENASALLDDAGRLVCYEGTVEDITDRKRAQETLMERSRLSILEAEVGVALCQRGELSEILQTCAEMMAGQLDCNLARVWTVDLDPTYLTLQAQVNRNTNNALHLDIPLLDDALRDKISLSTPELSTVAAVARSRNPLFRSECALIPHQGRSRTEVHFAGFPLVVEDRLVGALALYRVEPFAEAVQDALGWLASAIAVGIDRAQARQELTTRREALLFQLAAQIRNSLDLDTVLESAVQGIRNLLDTDRCLFAWYITDAGGGIPAWDVVNESRTPAVPSALGPYHHIHASYFLQQLMWSKCVRADDVSRLDNPTLRQMMEDRGYRSLLALPVQTRSGAIGVIECGQSAQVRTWSEREVELLRAVTDQLSTAIDQAELYAKAQVTAVQAQDQAKRLSTALQELKTAQTQLIQNEKMSSLGQMVAGIAHEINNPTTFIHGNLTYARRYTQELLSLIQHYRDSYPVPTEAVANFSRDIDVDFLCDDLPKTLQSMQLGAERIRQIVASLRNFSRLDQAEMKPVNIHEGIENTLLILQHRFKANSNFPGIEVEKHYGDLPLVVCYAGQLNQVFMNVISNAIDALEDRYGRSRNLRAQALRSAQVEEASLVAGSGNNSKVWITDNLEDRPIATSIVMPRLTITTELMSGEQVRILIADNGNGMSDEVRSKLFDPFFTTKPVGQGTGLGLSISYQIVVEKHRGTLDCRPAEGGGTEFLIEIPIEQPEWNEST